MKTMKGYEMQQLGKSHKDNSELAKGKEGPSELEKVYMDKDGELWVKEYSKNGMELVFLREINFINDQGDYLLASEEVVAVEDHAEVKKRGFEPLGFLGDAPKTVTRKKNRGLSLW